MPRFIALLRGINVGGHRVSMSDLKATFEALGFSKVETFIASGNVIFETPETDTAALEGQIEAHLNVALGYEVATFLRTPEALQKALRDSPFIASGTGSLYITFLKATLSEAHQSALSLLPTKTDAFGFASCEIYRLFSGKLTDSDVSDATYNRLLRGVLGTTRNVTTVQKLAEKYKNK
jgi:uncharacterized protein (DUF1697 family)